MSKVILDEEFEEFILEHSYNLSTLKHTLNFLHYCLESDVYCETVVEHYSLMIIINKFIDKIKTDYDEILDKLGVPR